MRSRAEAFDEYVLTAMDACEKEWQTSLDGIDVGVEDVPPSEPTAWEDAIVLGRSFPPHSGQRARLVVYRLPITTRARSPLEQMSLVHHVVRQHLAELLGRSPEGEDFS